MSRAGPRPLLVQVSGRSTLSWKECFAQNVEYAESQSLLLDLKILFRIVVIVFKRDGISAKGLPAMTEFMGASAAADPVEAKDRGNADRIDKVART